MKGSRRSTLLGIIGPLSVVVGITALAHAGDDNDRRHFKATLVGFNETPSISSPGQGSVDLRINGDDTAIDFVLHYEGLTGNPLFAHIHLGQRHTAGGVAIFFCGGGGKPACPPQPATITGTLDAAGIIGPTTQGIAPGELDELIRAMRAGATYANVHTPMFPTGEIRGQIGPNRD
jgi:CHRD domain